MNSPRYIVTFNEHPVKFLSESPRKMWCVVRRDEATVFDSCKAAADCIERFQMKPAKLVEVIEL